MTDPLKEALWFYTAADYLVVNSFLWRNAEALEPCLEIVYNNNAGVINEAREQTAEKRFAFSGLDCAELYSAYLRRTPKELSFEGKRGMLGQAIADVRLICAAARPVGEDMLLYRNLGKGTALRGVTPGGRVDLRGITSTSTTGQPIDYGKGNYRAPEQILRLRIPGGFPVLNLENGENEVLLPPASYLAVSEQTLQGVAVIELAAESISDVEELIASAKRTFAQYFREQRDGA